MFAEWMTWEDIYKTQTKSSPAKYAFLWCLPSINRFHTILSFYKMKWLLEYEKSRSVEFTRAANTQSKIFFWGHWKARQKCHFYWGNETRSVLEVVAPVSAAFLQEQESQKVGNKGYHHWKKRWRTTAGRNERTVESTPNHTWGLHRRKQKRNDSHTETRGFHYQHPRVAFTIAVVMLPYPKPNVSLRTIS